jgi:hypothetical protein
MLDFGNLPKPLTGTVDYFPGFCNSVGTDWRVWNKPRNCTFIRILCIGAGGGGGGGGSANGGGTNAGGGGGGGSGAITTLTIPAIFVPDRIYVSAGTGGAGANTTGLAGFTVNGSAGVLSLVSIVPANVNIYILCYANAGSGGSGGSTSAGGGGGTAASVGSIATANQGFQGHFNPIAGANGGAGGGFGVGGSITYPTTGLLLSGGSGGGGILSNSSSAAGDVNAPTSQSSVYTLFQTLTAAAYYDGQNGIELSVPLMSCGGVGGGAFTNGGNNGGNGGFGSGGGGGGASVTTSAIGGKGGKGGDGLVVIQTW